MAPQIYPEKYSENIFTSGKKIFILLVIGMFLFSLNFIVAQEHFDEDFEDEEFLTDWDGTCGDFDCDELEIIDAGTTPDSAFYFLDEFFDRFGDDLEIREEKVAEIKAMVEDGNFEAAREALEKYKEHSENLEEIDPEREEEARRSSITIEKTLREIEEDIPLEYRDDLFEGIIIKERKIRTAVEISSKIKELCVQLAELDPVEYSKVCDFKDDAPKWKRQLDEDLTEEQRGEAKKFGQIMSQCFQTSGRDCKCGDISFYDFSLACSKVAPLAAKCDAGSEDACERMDEIEMPKLPGHLQDIFEDIEDQFGEDKYDMHMPPECVRAGATSPKECGRIMIKENAPIECRKALLEADVQNEREGREICEKIMFELHAPIECIDEGITDPEECKDFMDTFRHDDGPRGPGGFGAPGRDCIGIEDSTERLTCFENAVGDMGNRYGIGDKFEDGGGEITWQCKENRIHWGPDCEIFMREEWPQQERMREEERHNLEFERDDWRLKEKECAASCDLKNGWWDFSDGECVCTTEDYKGPREGEWQGYDCAAMYCQEGTHCEPDFGCVSDQGSSSGGESFVSCDDCESECGSRTGQRLRSTSCGPNGCECFWESDEPDYAEGEGFSDGGSTESSEPTSSDSGSTDSGSSDTTSSNSGSSNSDSATITGEVTGNKFLDYD